MPMPPTHKCGKCGVTGTCAYTAPKYAHVSPGLPRSVGMSGHECPAVDKYVTFHVTADLMPGMEAQFELNRQAARERREALGASGDEPARELNRQAAGERGEVLGASGEEPARAPRRKARA